MSRTFEIARGIVGVAGRIEGVLERGKRLGVEVHVDLHATDIDIAHAASHEFLNLRDRCPLAREILMTFTEGNRPRPWIMAPGIAIPVPRLGDGDGAHEFMRDAMGLFSLVRVVPAT